MLEEHIHSNSAIIESIRYLGYFGDVAFAATGALVAARKKMDIIGYMLLGAITGMGGGTVRDLILDRPVFWLTDSFELILCVGTAIVIMLVIKIQQNINESRMLLWADALGLSAFAVQGAHIAAISGASVFSALFIGVLSAVGGGLMRDIICGEKPFMLSGEIYALAALIGTALYLHLLLHTSLPEYVTTIIGFSVIIGLRAIGILFGVSFAPKVQR